MPPYVVIQLVALSAIAAVVCFLAFKASARFERHRLAEEQALKAMRGMQATTMAMKAEIEELREVCRDLASRPVLAAPGMHPGKRSQALRMLRQGEAVESVAAVLRLPRSHVQLLLKVCPAADSSGRFSKAARA